MVYISTIILIANLIALVWKGVPFMSFWWVLLCYVVEIILYIVIYIVIYVIGLKIFKRLAE